MNIKSTSPNSPWASYQADLEAKRIQPDPEQQIIIKQLQTIFEAYLAWREEQATIQYRFKKIFHKTVDFHQRGLYLWGGVGIGKTYLMDCFFDALPGERKKRIHFHHFMRDIHRQLHLLQGTADPLLTIAKTFTENTDILCFDEFMVHEIADAMVLGGLMRALFQRGIILITTSNIAPDRLYENGLHRELFIPVIEMIQQHCRVIHCHTESDYRLEHIKQHGVYFQPITEQSHQMMMTSFTELASGHYQLNTQIEILGRNIPALGRGSEVVWFDFHDLCALGRSKLEYLELAQEYHTVLISHTPILAPAQTDRVIFFMYLIDILYDANVNVIIEADGPIESIYTSGPQIKPFQRTQSRLHEMQSDAYIKAPHLLALLQ